MAEFRGKVDKFGNEICNVVCVDKGGRGYFKGFLELPGGKLLQVEVQPQTAEGRKGDDVMWVRVTKKRAQRQAAAPRRTGGAGW